MKTREQKIYLIWRYALLFLLNALVVTASFRLFFHSIDLDLALIRKNGLLVFGNVFFLSALCCAIEWGLKKLTTDRMVRRIREAAGKMASGDFSARIDLNHFPSFEPDYDEIARDMNRMAEELSATETLRTDFVSNVSHELKTPLAVIRNYASLMKTPGISEEKKQEYVEGISRAVDKTSVLMSNILRLNKLENQKMSVNRETFDLGNQIAECLTGFEDMWEQKNIQIEADLEEGLTVSTDPELLTIVWNNLISNAIKFTDPGGTVTVSAHRGVNGIEASVRDTGCGMDEKTGRHIFDKFFQGDTSHATEGNGLGLAMVKRIVDLTGGEILVDSRPGEGSTFTVLIKQEAEG